MFKVEVQCALSSNNMRDKTQIKCEKQIQQVVRAGVKPRTAELRF